MAIVTISRGSYSHGKEVAEKVAQKLGYRCISREVMIEASEEFNVPEIKLVQALRDAPSLLARFGLDDKSRYIAYVRSALLDHLREDNVVYHGLAGHFLVRQISHVLKVRITAEMEDRVKVMMERVGIASESEALRAVKQLDEARRKWSLHIYGIDTNDTNLYDLLIRIKKLTTDDAADLICRSARLDHFQATAESRQAIEDLALAARAKAVLIERFPRVTVTASGDAVQVGLEGLGTREEKEIRDTVGQLSGVRKIDVGSHALATPDA